ncbi:uncharacterized protein [Choristoneura fumiferana]|uniref:uncharacterized protein n=1 Tax=Choristoneura fumiferana TaxID=7141 RepID=UPI003D15D3E3
MDKQEVKRSSKTRLWLSARRKKKGPARHKKENINPNSTLGTGEHASEQSDSDNNTDPPPQFQNFSRWGSPRRPRHRTPRRDPPVRTHYHSFLVGFRLENGTAADESIASL